MRNTRDVAIATCFPSGDETRPYSVSTNSRLITAIDMVITKAIHLRIPEFMGVKNPYGFAIRVLTEVDTRVSTSSAASCPVPRARE